MMGAMRWTRRLLVVLLVAVLCVSGVFATPACAAEPPDAPLREITGQQLAGDVRNALDRYTAAYLEAEFDEERNARAFGAAQDGPPEVLRWSGSLKFAGDGRRWQAKLVSKTISFVAEQSGGMQRAKALPRHDVAGFDGERHYPTNRFGGSIVGEENVELARQCPADLFWSSLNDGETLLSTLADPKTSILGQELHGGFRSPTNAVNSRCMGFIKAHGHSRFRPTVF